MKRVLILHGFTTDYRVPFFKELNRILLANNILMKVVVGQSSKYEKFAEIEDCDFFINVHNIYFYFGRRYIVWEPVLKYLKGNDLIIMRQAKRHLSNPLVYLYCRLSGIRIAIWGNLKQYIHKQILRPILSYNFQVDHWFAYNDVTKKIIESSGYPSEKITSLNNTIDTKGERKIYISIPDEEINLVRANYNVNSKDIVGILCSRLYTDKRIDFLINTLVRVKRIVPDFKFFVIGDGEESYKIKEFTSKNDTWFYWVGSQYGREKIKFFRISDFQLLPGAVGMHIIDSFAFETPIITTLNQTHGVEIDYMKNYKNGIICENTVDAYAEWIVKVCKEPDLRLKLKEGCREGADYYTIENMASRFASGIIKCLYTNSDSG